jgi:predicted CXXCH cytochrome family protein
MRSVLWSILGGTLLLGSVAAASSLPDDYSCTFCHGKTGTLSEAEDTKHLVVDEGNLAGDVHWQKGIRCHDCHGGSPKLDDFADHRDDPTFRSVVAPKDIPEFCGRCHSDIQYMRQYQPSPRTDQLAEYWTSGHGQRLKATGDSDVATCVSCHGHHDIRAIDDPLAPVYPTRLAETCAVCHSDAKRMANRQYHGRPLGHDQYALWRKSVHAEALLKKEDLSAPTCNDCHGNHGALPPQVDSVANACGTCHVKVASLFAATRMKHRFEEVALPGCATCHGNHEIRSPSDEMLGMKPDAVCARCHGEGKGKYGATLAGAESARTMRAGLEELKGRIAEAETKLDEAERLGMEVRKPRYQLREARDALVNARSLVHGFSVEPVEEVLDRGLEVSAQVEGDAVKALKEYVFRRIWLALSLLPILVVMGLLALYIRSLPLPAKCEPEAPETTPPNEDRESQDRPGEGGRV